MTLQVEAPDPAMVRISVDYNPSIPEEKQRIPHGTHGTLIYATGPVLTYDTDGVPVKIASIARYECDGCGLIAYSPEVSKAMELEIRSTREKLGMPNIRFQF